MGYSARRDASIPIKAFACAFLCALFCLIATMAPGASRAAIFLEAPPTISGDTAPSKFRFTTENSYGTHPTVAFRPAGASSWVRCSSLREWTQSSLADGTYEFSIADDVPAVLDGKENPDCSTAAPATPIATFRFSLDREAPTVHSANVVESSDGSLKFEVVASDAGGLDEVKWDFGDGSSFTSSALWAAHSYDGLRPKFAVAYLSDLANNFTAVPLALPVKEVIVLGAAERSVDDGNAATCARAKKSLSRKRVLLQRLLKQYRKKRTAKLRRKINRVRRDLRRVKSTVYDACG